MPQSVHSLKPLERIASTMTLAQAAEELELSKNAVRSMMERRGLRCRSESQQTARDYVQDMQPLDAIDYLIGVIEALTSADSDESHPVYDLPLTRSERRLVKLLMDRPNQPVRKKVIYDCIYHDRPDYDELPLQKIIDVFVSKIRKKLPPEHGQIETIWGEGYRWVPA